MYSTFEEAAALQKGGGLAAAGPGMAFRKKLNIVPILLAMFLPWLVYCGSFSVLSFYYHFRYAYTVYAVIGAILMFVVMTGAFALDTLKNRSEGSTMMEPHWYTFIFVTSLLGWILGVTCGQYNFYYCMQPYYDVVSLNMYDGVDPSRTQGVELMDAGRIIFTNHATLDLQKASGFRNSRTYCAAPITVFEGSNVTVKPLLRYDFWAVGTDCCSGNHFRCGAYDTPRAHAGLRLLRDDERGFFRLAVQQAEAAYGIKTVHPLFFHWLDDPNTEAAAYQEDGFRWYFLGMFTFFVMQFVMVTGAVTTFARWEKWTVL